MDKIKTCNHHHRNVFFFSPPCFSFPHFSIFYFSRDFYISLLYFGEAVDRTCVIQWVPEFMILLGDFEVTILNDYLLNPQ